VAKRCLDEDLLAAAEVEPFNGSGWEENIAKIAPKLS